MTPQIAWFLAGMLAAFSVSALIVLGVSLFLPKDTDDDAELSRLWERGSEAWKDVPNASEWVDELRGGHELSLLVSPLMVWRRVRPRSDQASGAVT